MTLKPKIRFLSIESIQMRYLIDFIKGNNTFNAYVLVGLVGSLMLGFFVYNFHIEYMYSASSSDHILLWTILNKGALLLVTSLTFSFVVYSSIWQYKRRGGSHSVALITLACAHFLSFTLLSTLLISANAYRAAEGILTKEHQSLRSTLDD